jgi:tetratricopeptide (TPR) repeat protein
MFAMPYELHIRFGRWDAILGEQDLPENLPIARAFRRYARGVAFAAKKQLLEARAEQLAFLEAKRAIPKEAMFVMNPAENVLAVAEAMLEGEILYREGAWEKAVAALRDAVRREDSLRCIEPPDWIQPVRHALGATLMDAGKPVDAEEVYRQDLIRHPNNGWSLQGLARSLQRQGRTKEAEETLKQFEVAWQHADVKTSSSCFCLPGKK